MATSLTQDHIFPPEEMREIMQDFEESNFMGDQDGDTQVSHAQELWELKDDPDAFNEKYQEFKDDPTGSTLNEVTEEMAYIQKVYTNLGEISRSDGRAEAPSLAEVDGYPPADKAQVILANLTTDEIENCADSTQELWGLSFGDPEEFAAEYEKQSMTPMEDGELGESRLYEVMGDVDRIEEQHIEEQHAEQNNALVAEQQYPDEDLVQTQDPISAFLEEGIELAGNVMSEIENVASRFGLTSPEEPTGIEDSTIADATTITNATNDGPENTNENPEPQPDVTPTAPGGMG